MPGLSLGALAQRARLQKQARGSVLRDYVIPRALLGSGVGAGFGLLNWAAADEPTPGNPAPTFLGSVAGGALLGGSVGGLSGALRGWAAQRARNSEPRGSDEPPAWRPPRVGPMRHGPDVELSSNDAAAVVSDIVAGSPRLQRLDKLTKEIRELSLADVIEPYYKNAPGGLDKAVEIAQKHLEGGLDAGWHGQDLVPWDPKNLRVKHPVRFVDAPSLEVDSAGSLKGLTLHAGGPLDADTDWTISKPVRTYVAAPGGKLNDPDVRGTLEHELTHSGILPSNMSARRRHERYNTDPAIEPPSLRPRLFGGGNPDWEAYAGTAEELKAFAAPAKREWVQRHGKQLETHEEARQAIYEFIQKYRRSGGDQKEVARWLEQAMQDKNSQRTLTQQLLQIVGLPTRGDVKYASLGALGARYRSKQLGGARKCAGVFYKDIEPTGIGLQVATDGAPARPAALFAMTERHRAPRMLTKLWDNPGRNHQNDFTRAIDKAEQIHKREPNLYGEDIHPDRQREMLISVLLQQQNKHRYRNIQPERLLALIASRPEGWKVDVPKDIGENFDNFLGPDPAAPEQERRRKQAAAPGDPNPYAPPTQRASLRMPALPYPGWRAHRWRDSGLPRTSSRPSALMRYQPELRRALSAGVEFVPAVSAARRLTLRSSQPPRSTNTRLWDSAARMHQFNRSANEYGSPFLGGRRYAYRSPERLMPMLSRREAWRRPSLSNLGRAVKYHPKTTATAGVGGAVAIAAAIQQLRRAFGWE